MPSDAQPLEHALGKLRRELVLGRVHCHPVAEVRAEVLADAQVLARRRDVRVERRRDVAVRDRLQRRRKVCEHVHLRERGDGHEQLLLLAEHKAEAVVLERLQHRADPRVGKLDDVREALQRGQRGLERLHVARGRKLVRGKRLGELRGQRAGQARGHVVDGVGAREAHEQHDLPLALREPRPLGGLDRQPGRRAELALALRRVRGLRAAQVLAQGADRRARARQLLPDAQLLVPLLLRGLHAREQRARAVGAGVAQDAHEVKDHVVLRERDVPVVERVHDLGDVAHAQAREQLGQELRRAHLCVVRVQKKREVLAGLLVKAVRRGVAHKGAEAQHRARLVLRAVFFLDHAEDLAAAVHAQVREQHAPGCGRHVEKVLLDPAAHGRFVVRAELDAGVRERGKHLRHVVRRQRIHHAQQRQPVVPVVRRLLRQPADFAEEAQRACQLARVGHAHVCDR